MTEKVDYLKVELSDSAKSNPKVVNDLIQYITKITPDILGVTPEFAKEVRCQGDTEKTAYVEGNMPNKQQLLNDMLVGRTIASVNNDYDKVSLIFKDGTSVDFDIVWEGGQLHEIKVSKEVYVTGTSIKTVSV